ncbi:MAG: hypothetical protein DPW18_12360 [Chloroflexi bacterium]|nr:hypothetical protein [Chloroflexota bacterium]
MTRKPFLPRKFFLLTAVWMTVLSTFACGVAEQPAATEPTFEAATEEAAATKIPPGTAIPVQTAIPAQPAILETRRLTLEYPARMKAAAESDIVRLTLEVDDLGNVTPTAQFAGNVVEGEVIKIPNLYETHNVMAEARFDIAGMEVQPPGATFQPLKQGEPVTFYWSVRPPEVGTYRGTVWLHLVFTERSTGEESRMAVSAQTVEIEAVDFFGFSTNFVRTSGVVGSVLGVIVGLPFFDDVVKFFLNRLGRRRRKTSRSARKI